MLMERLRCTAVQARAQLNRLADATGVTAAEMAATVIGTDPADGSGTVPDSGARVAAAVAAGAADGAELAEALAGQVSPFGPGALAIWLLGADGSLDLLGSVGFAEQVASRWRHIPPQLDCPAQRVAGGAPELWWPLGVPAGVPVQVIGEPDAARGVLALRDRGELIGVLE